MSKEYEGRDLKDIAASAEQDLNDRRHNFGYQDGTGFGGKTVGGGSTSTDESGIDLAATKEFPGSTAGSFSPDRSPSEPKLTVATPDYGDKVTGGTIPPEEGGDVQKGTGKLTKAGDFEDGVAGEGPEDVLKRREQDTGGDDDIRSNIRQHAPQKASS